MFNKFNYSELKVKKLNAIEWELTEDWITPFGIVPKGFVTDGASVPRVAWIFYSPTGILWEASVIHDYLYKNAIKTKDYADKAFYKTGVIFNNKPKRTYVAYLFVKLIGKGAY